jgi:endoglucanase
MKKFCRTLARACLMLIASNNLVVADPSPAGSAAPNQSPRSLAGALKSETNWRAYVARFVTADGRVVDTANGAVSHSEGQGYGMLLAVAASDRSAFERIWGWTRANLMTRDDALLAWRWEPNQRPAVADMNNATDGDLLVAWALTEAAEAWSDASYRTAARRLAVEIGRKLVVHTAEGEQLLLPALAGFSAEDVADGPVINLSYYVFPAFSRLAIVAPEFDWAGLSRSGLRLIERAQFGPYKLPSEWISAKQEKLTPAAGFVPAFSYNSIRMPLYMAWAGVGRAADYAPFLELWAKRSSAGLPLIDLASNRIAGTTAEHGYEALPAFTSCAITHTPLPRAFWDVSFKENYYPVTLQLLSQAAVHMREPSC